MLTVPIVLTRVADARTASRKIDNHALVLAAFANFVFVSCAIHHANVQGGVSNSVPTSMDNVTSINKGCGNYVEVMDSNYIELVSCVAAVQATPTASGPIGARRCEAHPKSSILRQFL